jgi:teichuronic acid biosynthesis glycosyltransferase TuaH
MLGKEFISGRIVNSIVRNNSYINHSHNYSFTENSLDSLKEILVKGEYSNVLIMGSCEMGWHEVFKQRHHHIAENLIKKGWLVFCAINSHYVDDQVDLIKKEKNNLFLVNFECRKKWRIIIDTIVTHITKPLFYHLVGTEPSTTIDEIELLKNYGIKIYYDYLDEISREINLGLPEMCFQRHERLLTDEEVIVIATSDLLVKKASKYRNRNIYCATNGVTIEDWEKETNLDVPPEIMPAIRDGNKIIGYYGSFASWMDYECIKQLSQKRPEYNIVMIGYDYHWGKGPFTESGIEHLKNVYIIPPQKYDRLRNFSQFFDVGIIPFRDYELTQTVSPVKMFEYMAQRIPTVATGLQECKKYKSCLNAESPEDFVDKVDYALELKSSEVHLDLLYNDAINNTWKSRATVVDDILTKSTIKHDRKILSIIVPTYNMEQYLDRCISSMIYQSCTDDLEIIIVNDGSKDNSKFIATNYENKYPSVVRVINKKNGGHGSCINTGIKEANAEYFKIVDADDWLNPLDLLMHINFLKRNRHAEMVLTNYIRSHESGEETAVSYLDRLHNLNGDIYRAFNNFLVDDSHLSYAHMHAVTYKTDILKDNNISITENSYYVDQEYISLPMKHINTFTYQNIILYRYFIGRPGQSVDPIVASKKIHQNINILGNLILNSKSTIDYIKKCYLKNICFHQSWHILSLSTSDEVDEAIYNTWVNYDINILEKLILHFPRLKRHN